MSDRARDFLLRLAEATPRERRAIARRLAAAPAGGAAKVVVETPSAMKKARYGATTPRTEQESLEVLTGTRNTP